MRAIRRVLSLVVFLFVTASVASAADPYAEYRIPDHRWLSWSASLNGSGTRQLTHSGSQYVDRQYGGTGFTSIVGGYDSDAHSRAYGLSLQLSGDRHTFDLSDQRVFGTFDQHRRDQDTQERASLFFAVSRFPWQAPLGFSLATSDAFQMSQSWSAEDKVTTRPPQFSFPGTREEETFNGTTGTYDANASLSASVNWGRVRDATPVYQVQVLEQRLRETGAIQSALSRGARERLTALYTVESELSFAHQRPTKYFWRELERLLTEDGVLGAGGLDAYTVQRLVEPLALSKSFARIRGYSFGPQVILTKQWSHASELFELRRQFFVADTLFGSSSFIRPRTETNDHEEGISSGAFVEYHRPFGMQWQADAFSRALVSKGRENLNLTSALNLAWAIADRWQWTGSVRHDALAQRADEVRKVTNWRLNAALNLNYFFEDAWAFQLGYAHRQDHSQTSFRRTDNYTLGVTYQFAGWLDAPAVFAPMRLTPPAR